MAFSTTTWRCFNEGNFEEYHLLCSKSSKKYNFECAGVEFENISSKNILHRNVLLVFLYNLMVTKMIIPLYEMFPQLEALKEQQLARHQIYITNVFLRATTLPT